VIAPIFVQNLEDCQILMCKVGVVVDIHEESPRRAPQTPLRTFCLRAENIICLDYDVTKDNGNEFLTWKTSGCLQPFAQVPRLFVYSKTTS
jgi:hypothetical protein